ncbi:hypothetical protein [Flagellimonas onchidii]|uniref:hypothetical protein n=1 Tax=Flagellimonas onchidii TaxID=2562684 RepID=UPI0010A5E931|nr:hypothetical protein [Allomuricauda onchidii]
MSRSDNIFLFLANDEALRLYDESLNKLLDSKCMDFHMEHVPLNWDEKKHTGEWEDYRVVDYETYRELHHNLCFKYREKLRQSSAQQPDHKKDNGG